MKNTVESDSDGHATVDRVGTTATFSLRVAGDKHLIMHYDSTRGLVVLMAGLVRGVGKYYGEYLNVSIVDDAVPIKFP